MGLLRAAVRDADSLRHLTWLDCRLLGQAFLSVLAAHAAVRWYPPDRLFAPASCAAPDGVPAALLLWAVRSVAARVPRSTCLVHAWAARRLLARHGYPSELRLGCLKIQGAFQAHAWLEYRGSVILGDTGVRYLPFGRPD